MSIIEKRKWPRVCICHGETPRVVHGIKDGDIFYACTVTNEKCETVADEGLNMPKPNDKI